MDLKLKHRALMIQWIFTAQHNEMLHQFLYKALDTQLNQEIWLCNLCHKDIHLVGLEDSFWKQVLVNWSKYNFNWPNTYQEVLGQYLWLNSHIKVNKQPIVIKQMLVKGIKYVKDLLNTNNTLMTFE